MAFSTAVLRANALRARPRVSLNEARRQNLRTAFLSHSHRDAELAKGLSETLAAAGWTVYIDWEDTVMPETPDRATATRIQEKILSHTLFLFLATPNSVASRWCPWELGFADGRKQRDTIYVVPTTDGGTTSGNEYLQLYRRIEPGPDGIRLFEAASSAGRALT